MPRKRQHYPPRSHQSQQPKPAQVRWPQFAVVAAVVILVGLVFFLKSRDAGRPTVAASQSIATGSPIAAEGQAQATAALIHEQLAARPGQPTVLTGGTTARLLAQAFHSNNCKQCLTMMEVVEQVYPEFANSVALVDVNVYDERNAALLQQARIRAIPSQIDRRGTGTGRPWRDGTGAASPGATNPGRSTVTCPSILPSCRPVRCWRTCWVFLGGVVTSIGPCNVAMIPLIIGFVGGSSHVGRGRSFALSLTFAVGLAVTFMLLGVVASLVGGLVGGTSRLWYYVVAAVCLLIGLSMLGAFRLPEVSGLARLRERIRLRGLPGALALGLVSGLVASQCATPVLAAILTYVMSQEGALAYGAALLFVYALGRGVPIVLAGTFAGALKQLQSLGRWSPLMERISGVIIVGVGLYFLWIA